MPWIVQGQAGEALRLVKGFLSGQWLCDQIGAKGSGCGHTLHSGSERVRQIEHTLGKEVHHKLHSIESGESAKKPHILRAAEVERRNSFDGKGGDINVPSGTTRSNKKAGAG
jgi:hypothetical protein